MTSQRLCLRQAKKTTESIDSEFTEPLSPWPLICKWVKCKKMVDDSYIFHCWFCLPKITEVNLTRHFNKIRPVMANLVDEACNANVRTGAPAGTYAADRPQTAGQPAKSGGRCILPRPLASWPRAATSCSPPMARQL